MSKKKLRVGVVGCGDAAKIGHLPTYQKSPLSEIIAIADPVEAHLKEVQDLYNVPKAYSNPDELLDDPDIDAISICSPHWAHLNQVLRAAENGKHVLCEKPLGLNLEEVDKMIKAVEKNKILFQTATQKRFDHAFQYIKEQIIKKTIGDIFHVSIFWYHSMPDLGPNPKKELIEGGRMWRLLDKRCGGGDLLDHGPHYFDLFRWWFGDIKSVYAQVRRINQSRVNEDHMNIILTFKNENITASFERSQAIFGDPFGEEKGRIHGTKGNYFFEVPHAYFVEPMRIQQQTRRKSMKNIGKELPKDGWNLSYAREVRSFINQALDVSNDDVGFPEKWIPTIHDGRAALELVLASYESSRTQEIINLPLKQYTPPVWC